MYLLKPGGLVFLGAALGTLARALTDTLLGAQIGGINASTMLVNVLGAMLMGALVATWTQKRGLKPLWDSIKIFAGTGFLGAFTTYSTFALAIAHAGAWQALGVGTLVVAAGVFGAWLGKTLASRGASNSGGGSQ
ncbi:MAG: CrcB family protein [Actinomycetaceae bacterium]|nr:CrcB family protein [Actinomycetaceae bacterium]